MEYNAEKLTIKSLTALAKKRGIKGYSRLNKTNFTRLLKVEDEFKSVKNLKLIAKQKGLTLTRLMDHICP